MHSFIDFFIHLAFGGFLFLCLLYVLRVVFFSSVDNLQHSRGEDRLTDGSVERAALFADSLRATKPDTVEAEKVALS